MAKKYDNEDGVWRTIGGRRIFIKNGQDLASAMKESGKFKSAKKFSKREELKKDIAHQVTEAEKNGNTAHAEAGKRELERLNNEEKAKKVEKGTKIDPYDDPESEESQRLQYIQSRYDEYLQATEGRGASYGELAHIEGLRGKELDDFEKELDNFEESDLDKVKRIQDDLDKKGDKLTKEEKAWKEQLANTQKELESGKSREDIIKDLDREAQRNTEKELESDKFSRVDRNKDLYKKLEEKEKDERLKNFLEERIERHERDLRKAKNEGDKEQIKRKKDILKEDTELLDDVKKRIRLGSKKTSNDIMNEKIRSRGKTKFEDDLPKRTEIKTQGTSNRKEVSDNIQAHILDYYSSDFTGEDIPATEAFVNQMDYMRAPNMWKAGEEIASGGSYLIYTDDMRKFLDDLKINPSGKEFSDDRVFETYKSLVGRESAKLYDRIQKNSYKKYMKAHPLSKMSFEEFKDMNKK